MSARTAYEEYLICRERGHHNPPGETFVTRGSPRETQCLKCGTWYRWTPPELVERGAPEPE